MFIFIGYLFGKDNKQNLVVQVLVQLIIDDDVLLACHLFSIQEIRVNPANPCHPRAIGEAQVSKLKINKRLQVGGDELVDNKYADNYY